MKKLFFAVLVAAAAALEVNQASISKALRDRSGRYAKLQARIILLAGWECDGPLWRLRK